MRLSVIISTYNYGEYLADAIDSALALDWPDVEVIVVDDGSTDDTADVIRGYGTRIVAKFQENAGQRLASNLGFACSTGDFIIFLDSDDMLAPSVAKEAARVWGPGVTKVQFQMMRVDAEGKPTGSVFPAYQPLPVPQTMRDWQARGLATPTPPGSGNVYARWYLEKLFPLDDSCGDAPDSACLAAAVWFGDVVTVAKPLVFYRLHDRNDSRTPDTGRFAREITRGKAKFQFGRRFAGTGRAGEEADLFNNIELLQFRVASLALRPEIHPLREDNKVKVMADSVRLFFQSSSSRLQLRMLVVAWTFLTVLSPRFVGRKLVAIRYK